MGSLQNSTNAVSRTEAETIPIPFSQLSIAQQAYVDWKALNGLVTEEDGTIRRMKIDEVAALVGMTRDGLQRAARRIPNLWELVEQRHKEIAPQSRLQKVRDAWYLKAAAGSFPHMQLWLANYDPSFRMPMQKVEHELGNSWMALLTAKSDVIEGEVVDD